MKTAAVIGGDIRQYHLASELEKNGYVVYRVHVPDRNRNTQDNSCYQRMAQLHHSIRNELSVLLVMKTCSILVLPIPVTDDSKTVKGEFCDDIILLSEIIDNLREGQIVFGGLIPEDFRKKCESLSVGCYDFMKMNSVAIRNAIATAEGAIAEAICMGEGNLHNSHVLIIGYGRCAKVLAERLKGMNAKVTVMARREDARAEACASGHRVLSMFREQQNADEAEHMIGMFMEYDYIFNTVPAMLLTEQVLQAFSKDVVIIDLASRPGGTDFDYCDKKQIRAKLCLGLPGKYAPAASGKILAQTVIQICSGL